jgi:hypothetical protein
VAESQGHRPSGNAFHTISTSSSSAGTWPAASPASGAAASPTSACPSFCARAWGLPEGVPGIVMAIDTFGEYLDFHPHVHALVADGLFARSGVFYVMPETGLKPLEEPFRAK